MKEPQSVFQKSGSGINRNLKKDSPKLGRRKQNYDNFTRIKMTRPQNEVNLKVKKTTTKMMTYSVT